MIKIENEFVSGFEEAIRGARNSWNSQEQSDSYDDEMYYVLGDNDLKLLSNLVKAGDSHAKAMRMVTVWFDMTAPRYFWTQFDTYKHVVRCSESTMHTIIKRDFVDDDFSCDTLFVEHYRLGDVIKGLNELRAEYLDNADDKKIQYMVWRDIIQLLPQSYNQKSTICTNYQTLRNMYLQRKDHKLEEWQVFCEFIESLPCAAELITV